MHSSSDNLINDVGISPFSSLPPYLSPWIVRVRGCLGSGHFGTVHKGMWQVPGGFVDVAVKTLKADASEDDEVKFLREAAIMGQFLHPNVVKLHGVVTVGKPVSGCEWECGREDVSGNMGRRVWECGRREGVGTWEGGCEWEHGRREGVSGKV